MKFLIKNGAVQLLLLLLLTFLLIWIAGEYILTPEFYASSGEPLSGIPGAGAGVLAIVQKWVYISAAAYLLIKLALITLILHTGLYLNNQVVSLRGIFKVTVLCEFLFLIPAAIKLGTFFYTHPNGTLLDWHQYYILSALTYFKTVHAAWYYPLQTFNLFEIAYWFLLAFGLRLTTSMNYDQSLKVVLVSYVPALLVWLSAVTFTALMIYPAAG